MVRQSLVERRVKDSDLRQSFAKQLARCRDAFEVRRIVQGRKIDAVFHSADHFIADQDRFLKLLAAVYDTMTNGLNIGNALDLVNARLLRRSPARDEINCGFNVS